jgi:beta-glucosidase
MTLLLGTALSVYQNSGDPGANWAHFEKKRTWRGRTVAPDNRIGTSVDFWDRYHDDIAVARDLGSNAFRFSVEWSRLEPERGTLDQAAFDRYHQIVDRIRECGMEPMATMHHFVHPQWFEQLGAFEREENLPLFIEHCVRSVAAFGDRVKLWGTINEPTVLTLMGYVLGQHAPGKTLRLGLLPVVLGNLMRAHAQAYRAVKPLHPELSIGLVHSVLNFEALPGSPFYVKRIAAFLDFAFAHERVLQFFERGTFDMPTPMGRVAFEDDAPLDFLGLNYYSRVMLNGWLFPTCLPDETMTDMPYASYPEGFGAALDRVCELGVPVYVTENGISDLKDDRRADFIRDYMAEFEAGLDRGLDLRGYFYWTLIDNFEWDQGFTQHFGLYDRERRGGGGAAGGGEGGVGVV